MLFIMALIDCCAGDQYELGYITGGLLVVPMANKKIKEDYLSMLERDYDKAKMMCYGAHYGKYVFHQIILKTCKAL